MRAHMSLLALLLYLCTACGPSSPSTGTPTSPDSTRKDSILAWQPVEYGAEVLVRQHLPELTGKRIGMVANHTARVFDSVHLVDTLQGAGLDIKFVAAAEHGFRGELGTGQEGASLSYDTQTGLPIYNLYYGPSAGQLRAQFAQVDVVLFDMQDVGARFYTYLRAMLFTMELCAATGTELWILDRPNPNGWYVDGPVRDSLKFKSIIGYHPVPMVHGLTLGEYAHMSLGEFWQGRPALNMRVLRCKHYHHAMQWEDTGRPWVPPSPNLATPQAAAYYPFLCWYEGTRISAGRGTATPFEHIGQAGEAGSWYKDFMQHPDSIAYWRVALPSFGYRPTSYTPRPIAGKVLEPKFDGQLCYGYRWQGRFNEVKPVWLLALQQLQSGYQAYLQVNAGTTWVDSFFVDYFERVVGNDSLRQQVISQQPVLEIYNEWQGPIERFKAIRRQYLLYPHEEEAL